ncbi:hypothetical protein SODG_006225 [Sodalis praecaptivus]
MFESALTYRLGNRQIGRMGYGAMQLAGPGAYGPPPMKQKPFRCCAMPSRLACAISIPAIFTDRTSPTGSSKSALPVSR